MKNRLNNKRMKKIIIMIMAALMAMPAVSMADNKPAKKKKGEIKEVTFNVKLHCNNCVKKVQENIAFEKGVKGLHVCLESQVIEIKYDAAKTNEETLKNAIVKLGVPVIGVSQHKHQHN